MTRRFHQRCLLWLLPLFVAQALVPVGFMVAAGERGIEVAFCPVQSAPLVAALSRGTSDGPTQTTAVEHSHHHDPAAHASHHGAGDVASHGGHDDEHAQHARSGSCPFALSGSPMLAAPAPSLSGVLVQIDHPRLLDPAPPSGVIRYDYNRIRGPPHLS